MKKNLMAFVAVSLCYAMIITAFSACSEIDNPVKPIDDVEGTSGVETFTPEILLNSSVYVPYDVDNDLRTAFVYATKEVSPVADLRHSVFVVNKLTDLDESLLKDAYEQGKTIAVVNPKKEEIDAYTAAHPWLDIFTDNIDDDLGIFGFNNDRTYILINKLHSHETSAGNLTEIEVGNTANGNFTEEYNTPGMDMSHAYYVSIASWLEELNEDLGNGVLKKANRAANGTNNKMSDFANYSHLHYVYNFSADHKFRKCASSKADYLKGSGSITIDYDVYMVHVYEGETGAGDYYGVNMTASIANENMWKGKGWNRHGGTYVRWCGFYCKDFSVTSQLTDAQMNPIPNITFTAGGSPSPETTVGKTTYKNEQSFSLELSQTVGLSGGKSDGKTKFDINGKLGFKEGWTWTNSTVREVFDTDVKNISSDNIAGWSLAFNNLPYFQYSESRGFKITDSQTYRSTSSIYGSWLWYDKTGKDNEEKAANYITIKVNANYGMMSWISSEADLNHDNIYFESQDIIALPKVINITAGTLELQNNLPNGATIYDVKVANAKTDEVYSTLKNTIPNGGTQVLGTFSTATKYKVTFIARATDGTTQTYAYSLHNDGLNTEHKAKTTLYAASDFSIK